MIVNGIAWKRSAERSVSACISSGAVMRVGSPPGAPAPRGRGARSVRSRRSRRGRGPPGPARAAISVRSGVWVSHACWASRWTTRYASSRARPAAHERQQHALGEQRAARELEVRAHAVGVDGHAAHHAQRQVLHVVEQDRRVRQHDALGARVRDVALVPQRDVLEPRLRVAAQHAREPGEPLGVDRVALVRHRARALLARRGTAPRPRGPRCAGGGGSRSPGARSRRRRARSPAAARRGGRAGRPGSRPARRPARGARARGARSPGRATRRCRPRRRSRRSRPARRPAAAARRCGGPRTRSRRA